MFNLVLDNLILQATFISGHENCVADALSVKFQEFKTMYPQAKPSSMPCPPFNKMTWLSMSKPLQDLLYSASNYIKLGLAKSTIKAYDSAWFFFSFFCTNLILIPLPVDMSAVVHLLYFIWIP